MNKICFADSVEKKLDALIDALGFDVDELADNLSCKCRHNALVLGGDRDCLKCFGVGYVVTSSYKLAKRDDRTIHVFGKSTVEITGTAFDRGNHE